MHSDADCISAFRLLILCLQIQLLMTLSKNQLSAQFLMHSDGPQCIKQQHFCASDHKRRVECVDHRPTLEKVNLRRASMRLSLEYAERKKNTLQKVLQKGFSYLLETLDHIITRACALPLAGSRRCFTVGGWGLCHIVRRMLSRWCLILSTVPQAVNPIQISIRCFIDVIYIPSFSPGCSVLSPYLRERVLQRVREPNFQSHRPVDHGHSHDVSGQDVHYEIKKIAPNETHNKENQIIWSNTSSVVWKPPHWSILNIIVDASFNGQGSGGVGCIMRNHQCSCLAALAKRVPYEEEKNQNRK
ncbi:uncharacterized protein G2W53_028845 [Senna tora]|uniref:Uncharacterized protein n=1 Tax=Senna tora TaxID=362788 RepID=A0A834T626_9FABA|nr:uncharacterized protein G2W53_028845 [Senna tora]